MTKSGKLKRYNSGIDNVHARLNDKKGGVNARQKYYDLTKNKVFLEKNFVKNLDLGKGISKKEVKSAFAKIRNLKEKELKSEYKNLKKERDERLKHFRKLLKKEKSKKKPNKEKIADLKREINFQKKSLDTQKEFVKNNLHDDLEFQDIRELFNSA